MKNTLIKILKIVIPLGIGVYLSWMFYNTLTPVEVDEVIVALKSTNYIWVVLALVIAWFSHYSRAYRWKYMIEPLGFKAKVSSMYHSLMIGYILNLTVPRSGEFARAGFFGKKEGIPFDKTFGTIVVERIIDVLMLGVITLITYGLVGQETIKKLTQSDNPSEPGTPWVLYGAIAVTVIGLVVFFTVPKIKKLIVEKFRGLWEGIKTVFTLKQKGLYIAHTLFIWIAYLVMFWVCAQGLADLNPKEGFFNPADMSVSTMLVCFVVGAVAMAVTPGGIGTYPLFVAGALIHFGHDPGLAKSFGVLMWLSQTVFMIVFGLYSLYAIDVKFTASEVQKEEAV